MAGLKSSIIQLLSANTWIISLSIIFILAMFLSWLEACVFRHLKPKLEKTKYLWDEAILHAFHLPYHVLVWLVAFSLMAPAIGAHFGIGELLIRFTTPVREFGFVVAAIWFSLRFISQVEAGMMQRAPRKAKSQDKTTIRAVSQLLRIVVVIIGILLTLQTFGISIAALLAFGGVGGLAISFAAKDTLANFFGGMMIFWDRPFSVGDWVRSPDREIEGSVEHIGWRLTRIRTFDKRPLYVPNALFSTVTIENPSRMSNRRLKTLIGIRYDDASKMATIVQDVETMLRQHPDIDAEQTLFVRFVEFAASSLNFQIYSFTKTTDWITFQTVQQDVFLRVIDIINQHGAECAFPTQTLHIPDLAQQQG